MSLPQPNTPEAVEPTLYLLEMDSTFNLRTAESQIIPFQVLNNATDLSVHRLLLPVHNKDANQEQLKVLGDTHKEPVVKFVSMQADNRSKPSLYQSQQLPVNLSSKPLPDLGNKIISLGPKIKTEPKVMCKKETKKYVHIPDRSIPPRAIAVLPTILQIRQKDVISPRRTLLPRTRFGPIQGIKRKLILKEYNDVLQTAMSNKRPLFIIKDAEEQILHIDVTDKDKANWIGLLPLGDDNSANVWIYEENSELYIITTEQVPSRKQLMLGYSTKYAEMYGLVGPTTDIDTVCPLSSKTWWCYECQRAMTSASLLQRHINVYHQDDKALAKRRRYRCRYCARTFSRIFTLKRHMARYCEKKPLKSEKTTNTETVAETILNTSMTSEDSTRVPSDESFNNYTNGLDFSTNLFDTDRIPSLDMSGNSRSEVFNPYGLDNIALPNDLEYNIGSTNKIDVSPNKSVEKNQVEKKIETSLTCTYCKQNVARGKKRQHLSECPAARRFECDCKKTFSTKDLLALHIYTEHSNYEKTEEEHTKDNNTSSASVPVENNKTYVCEQCNNAFKRRGMLVNHLWRVHGTESARVPLVRRERHYPCGACPKLYRTAAKRQRHRAKYHPDAVNIYTQEIDGGTRACSPAMCSECPRQYATRAKLLQHQRQHHPYLGPTPPKKKQPKENTAKTNERVATSEELLKYKTSLQHLLNFY